MPTTPLKHAFVQQLYRNVLQRADDPDGSAYWRSRADEGASAAELTRFFLASSEAAGVMTVVKLFDAVFDRAADSAGLSYWSGVMKGGASLAAIAGGLIGSAEFQARSAGLGATGFVDMLYLNLFGRAADAEGRAGWVARIESGAMTRAQVVESFVTSAEAQSSDGNAQRFAESYLVVRATGATAPTTAVEALAKLSLSDALAARLKAYPISVTDGRLIDGYVAGATVFADADGDGRLGPGEAWTTTDAKGNFNLTGGFGGLVAFGGTDLATGKPFKGVLKSAAGSTVVTPLTTLQQAFVERGLSVAQAELTVAKALGLDAGKFDLTSYDPMAIALDARLSATERGVAAQAQARAAQIVDFLVAGAKFLVGAAGGLDKLDLSSAEGALLTALASEIAADPDGVVSLTDRSFLQSALTASLALSGDPDLRAVAAKIGQMSEAFAAVVAASAERIDRVLAAGGDVAKIIAGVAQVQALTQGEIAEKLFAAAGDGDLASVQAAYAGAALERAVAGQSLGDLDPDSTADDAVTSVVVTVGTNAAAGGGGAAPSASASAPASAPAPPAALVSVTLAAGSDSGASASDGVTNVERPVLTGLAGKGATVTLYAADGATVLGQGVADADSGVWRIRPSVALSEGRQTLQVAATDPDGATGVTRALLPVTIDKTAPVLVLATVRRDVLTLSYDDASELSGAPDLGAFALTGTAAVLSGVAVDPLARTVTLTLSAPVTASSVVTFAYDPAIAGGYGIADLAGNSAGAFAVIPDLDAGLTIISDRVSAAENQLSAGRILVDSGHRDDHLSYDIVGGIDASMFSIDQSTGELSFIVAPDFEAPGSEMGTNSYGLVVRVSAGPGEMTTRAVAVDVTNLNEVMAGSVLLSKVADLHVGDVLTVNNTVKDPDVGGSWRPAFSYVWKAGGVAVQTGGDRYAVQNSDVGKAITLEATYLDPGLSPAGEFVTLIAGSPMALVGVAEPVSTPFD